MRALQKEYLTMHAEGIRLPCRCRLIAVFEKAIHKDGAMVFRTSLI
jgi:hypothetical protein